LIDEAKGNCCVECDVNDSMEDCAGFLMSAVVAKLKRRNFYVPECKRTAAETGTFNLENCTESRNKFPPF
jgi:hypothetical protein